MEKSKKQKSPILIAVFLAVAATSTTAHADTGCSAAPKSKFQDRAKIDDILKPKGLMINKIIDDHGCYKVIAVTKDYKKAVLFFNSETLKQVDKGTADDSDPDLKNSEAVGD